MVIVKNLNVLRGINKTIKKHYNNEVELLIDRNFKYILSIKAYRDDVNFENKINFDKIKYKNKTINIKYFPGVFYPYITLIEEI